MVKENLPAEVQEYLRQKGERLGTEYGALGGKASAANLSAAQRKRRAKKASDAVALTPEERKERARKAAQALWAKKKKDKAQS